MSQYHSNFMPLPANNGARDHLFTAILKVHDEVSGLLLDLIATGKYAEIYLDFGYSTVNGMRQKTTLTERPDLIAVDKDGKLNTFEVASKTDNPVELQRRLDNAMKTLPIELQGTTNVIPWPY